MLFRATALVVQSLTSGTRAVILYYPPYLYINLNYYYFSFR